MDGLREITEWVSKNSSVSGALISGVLGLFGGWIASLVPLINWGIEKRRKKLDLRRERIMKWQSMVSSPSFDAANFAQDAEYFALRPYLSKKLVGLIDSINLGTHIIALGSGANFLKIELLKEIGELQKKWNLI
jgi:hypothetical protein